MSTLARPSSQRPPSASASGAKRQVPWALLAWFALLLIICYAPVLRRLVRDWIYVDDLGHGFFVPLVAGYITWRMRDQLLNFDTSPSWWGLVLVVLAALQLCVATLGAELFLARTAFVLSVAGAVAFLGGTRLLRALSFPLVLLLFMIPLPAIIYNQITFPLQLLASRLAEHSLTLIGIPVLREGNILELPSQQLSVVEACSGIRSLLSLAFLALVYAWFFDPKRWMRPVLLLATVPIAIIANAGRVTLTALISEYDTELAGGFFHLAEGWVVFLGALVMLVATHGLINRLYSAVTRRRAA